jgi:hypothetical protein
MPTLLPCLPGILADMLLIAVEAIARGLAGARGAGGDNSALAHSVITPRRAMKTVTTPLISASVCPVPSIASMPCMLFQCIVSSVPTLPITQVNSPESSVRHITGMLRGSSSARTTLLQKRGQTSPCCQPRQYPPLIAAAAARWPHDLCVLRGAKQWRRVHLWS